MKLARVFTFFVLGLLGASVSAQEWEKFEFKAEPLAPGLTFLSGAGGNLVACHGEEGILLVDSDYEPMATKLLAALGALEAGPIRLVLNTHWHFDHVGGNAALAREGATIIAHASVRERMARGQLISVINETVPPADPDALPKITLIDTLTLHLNGETVDVWHLGPAHTDGDAVLRFRRADVIHVGDLWFHGGYPFIDVSSGGGIDGLIAALGDVLAVAGDSTRIVPGHGAIGSKVDLAKHRAMLAEFREIIAQEMAAGKELATIIAQKPTAKLDEVWGQRMFDPATFTETVYRSLGGE